MIFLARALATALWLAVPAVATTPGGTHPGAALDATLNRDLHLLERSLTTGTADARLRQYGLSANPNQRLKVWLYFDRFPSASQIASLEQPDIRLYPGTWIPPVGAHQWGFMLAEAPANRLKETVAQGLVKRAAAAYRQLQSCNDLTAEETGAAAARDRQPPLKGAGVRLAVIDSGFQLEQGDLPEAAAAMDYADYPDTNANVADLVSGHGTHVAGTVFGTGALSEGRWMGMAPEAEAIYLKIGDDSTTNASSAAVVGAVRAAATWCEADVATMSYGGFDGFNDGSSVEEQTVDWAVGEGVTVFMAAGNSAQARDHYSEILNAGATSDPIQLVAKYAPDSTFWELDLSWFDGPDTSVHLPLTAVILAGNLEDTIAYDLPEGISSPRGTELRQFLPSDPLPRDSAFFFAVVTNHSDQSVRFHLRAVTDNLYVRFENADPYYIVSLPSTADSCISVGAFISRTSWTNYQGHLQNNNSTRGALADFSSWGPRIDGMQKPDICAPGRQVISCRNTDIVRLNGQLADRIISNNGETGEPADYLALEGTSMATPAAAGSAGLVLELIPEYSPAELRLWLFENARADSFTGELPNYQWGWGKIDVAPVLAVDNRQGRESGAASDFRLLASYPNPFNGEFLIHYKSPAAGWIKFIIWDAAGRPVWSDSYYCAAAGAGLRAVKLPAGALPSGNYFIQAGSRGAAGARPITLLK